ncbi:MAG TPA: hypothetical protein VGJ85_08215 [Candidatus Nanopelagicaceae bacterium]
MFKLFFENAKEYDKLRDFISPPISWGRDELIRLLAARIREIHGKDSLSDNEAWALEFDTSKGLDKLQNYIISRCVSGPRDLIVYCNMAKDVASESKITQEIVENVEGTYSKEKLATLNRDFGRTYPHINDFLQQLFSGQKQTYKNEELVTLLTNEVITGNRIREMFSKEEYVFYATKERLIELLYSVGFLGIKRTKTSEVEFVITSPDTGSLGLYKAHEYRIHNAYRHYLNLTD